MPQSTCAGLGFGDITSLLVKLLISYCLLEAIVSALQVLSS